MEDRAGDVAEAEDELGRVKAAHEAEVAALRVRTVHRHTCCVGMVGIGLIRCRH